MEEEALVILPKNKFHNIPLGEQEGMVQTVCW